MKYLKSYNESKSSGEMKLNDIKNMFIYFYDNTKYSISVTKLKDSDLDIYKRYCDCLGVNPGKYPGLFE